MNANDNDLLTQVGPGTPMGSFLREFWVPACLSSELVADAPPLRIMLLGEKLIGFRRTDGRVGLMGHNCPHRGASLFFGRNEGDGLRCAYHGWKFNVDGQCTEMPNVPAASDFSAQLRAKSYPTAERNGLVYAYMGVASEPPALPQIDALRMPEGEMRITARQRECNYLQSLEGDLDTSHFGFLHLGGVSYDDVDHDEVHSTTILNRSPEYHCTESEWGTTYSAYRPSPRPGETYYRVSHYIFPFWTATPDADFDDNITTFASVPMDDTHTMVYNLFYKKRRDPMRRRKDGSAIPGLEPDADKLPIPMLPNDAGWFGRWRPAHNASNDYMIDRDMQRTQSFTGISSVFSQDQAMVESMGTTADRTAENLALSDIMVVRTRRRIMAALKAFCETGMLPSIVGTPGLLKGVRSGAFLAPDSVDWVEAYAEAQVTALKPEEIS